MFVWGSGSSPPKLRLEGVSAAEKTMKYVFTEETEIYEGRILHRIQNFANKELGGFIEKASNLSQYGNCWVYMAAKVYGNAKVFDNAEIKNGAKVYGNAKVFNNAEIKNGAKVYGNARIYNNARVHDNAKVYGSAHVADDSKVFGDAKIYGQARIKNFAKVSGKVKINGAAIVNGYTEVFGSDEYSSGIVNPTNSASSKKGSVHRNLNKLNTNNLKTFMKNKSLNRFKKVLQRLKEEDYENFF
jgi:carbonic anhydrase/acetyltransferase-like protein (isoleucine patch superfamily)